MTYIACIDSLDAEIRIHGHMVATNEKRRFMPTQKKMKISSNSGISKVAIRVVLNFLTVRPTVEVVKLP
jgi:hypothetical protein